MANNYDAFISFSLTESTNSGTQKTKSFYFGQYLSKILNDLCEIKTYFCDKDLENREDADFKKEIDKVISKTPVFILVLFNLKDYTKKHYFAQERIQYIKTHKKNPVIYILTNNDSFNTINDSPVSELIDGKILKKHAELFNVDNIESFETFLRTINNFILKDKKKVNDIKICRNCFKIFHDGNDEGTICCHHRHNDYSITEHKLTWSCCNKEENIDSVNQIINHSPGCINENFHKFKD